MPPKLIVKKRYQRRKTSQRQRQRQKQSASFNNVINFMTPVGHPNVRSKVATYSEVRKPRRRSMIGNPSSALHYFTPADVQVRLLQNRLVEEQRSKMTNQQKELVDKSEMQHYDNSIRGIAKREGIGRLSGKQAIQRRYLLKFLPQEFRSLIEPHDREKTDTIYRLFTSFVNDQHFDRYGNARYRQLSDKLVRDLEKIGLPSGRSLIIGAVKQSADQFVQDFVDDEIHDVPTETMVNPLGVETDVFIPARHMPPPMTTLQDVIPARPIRTPSRVAPLMRPEDISRRIHVEEPPYVPSQRDLSLAERTIAFFDPADVAGLTAEEVGKMMDDEPEIREFVEAGAQEEEQVTGEGRRRRRNLRGRAKPKNNSKLPNYYYY